MREREPGPQLSPCSPRSTKASHALAWVSSQLEYVTPSLCFVQNRAYSALTTKKEKKNTKQFTPTKNLATLPYHFPGGSGTLFILRININSSFCTAVCSLGSTPSDVALPDKSNGHPNKMLGDSISSALFQFKTRCVHYCDRGAHPGLQEQKQGALLCLGLPGKNVEVAHVLP